MDDKYIMDLYRVVGVVTTYCGKVKSYKLDDSNKLNLTVTTSEPYMKAIIDSELAQLKINNVSGITVEYID